MYVDQSTIPYLDGFWFLDGTACFMHSDLMRTIYVTLPSKHVAGPTYDNRNSFTPQNLVFGRPENRSFYDNFSESFSLLPFGPCDFVRPMWQSPSDVGLPLQSHL